MRNLRRNTIGILIALILSGQAFGGPAYDDRVVLANADFVASEQNTRFEECVHMLGVCDAAYNSQRILIGAQQNKITFLEDSLEDERQNNGNFLGIPDSGWFLLGVLTGAVAIGVSN